MVGLAALVALGHHGAEAGRAYGLPTAVLAGYTFYMSLCCTFFPAPTTGVVMFVAGNELGLIPSPVARVLIISLLGAFATSMANLNEYHILTFLLRHGRIGRVRETRLYRWAAGWFSVSPWTIIVVFSFIPIPVDVVRWLAIAHRYARDRFFAAYMLGRTVRYGILTLSAVWLNLTNRQIAAFQGLLILIGLTKVVVSVVKRRRPAVAAEPA